MVNSFSRRSAIIPFSYNNMGSSFPQSQTRMPIVCWEIIFICLSEPELKRQSCRYERRRTASLKGMPSLKRKLSLETHLGVSATNLPVFLKVTHRLSTKPTIVRVVCLKSHFVGWRSNQSIISPSWFITSTPVRRNTAFALIFGIIPILLTGHIFQIVERN